MKFSEAKFQALANLIAHGGPNGKGKPMWCSVNRIGKANTVFSLHNSECLMVNDKNPLLCRVTENGKRQFQAWDAMKKQAERELAREKARQEAVNA